MRINELARELEVKAKTILEYLAEIGTKEEKSHSSSVDEKLAATIIAHFQQQTEAPSPAEVPAAEEPALPAEPEEKAAPAKVETARAVPPPPQPRVPPTLEARPTPVRKPPVPSEPPPTPRRRTGFWPSGISMSDWPPRVRSASCSIPPCCGCSCAAACVCL